MNSYLTLTSVFDDNENMALVLLLIAVLTGTFLLPRIAKADWTFDNQGPTTDSAIPNPLNGSSNPYGYQIGVRFTGTDRGPAGFASQNFFNILINNNPILGQAALDSAYASAPTCSQSAPLTLPCKLRVGASVPTAVGSPSSSTTQYFLLNSTALYHYFFGKAEADRAGNLGSWSVGAIWFAPSGVQVTPSLSCPSGQVSGSITWSGPPNPVYGFYVDVSENPNFSTFMNKQVPAGGTTDFLGFNPNWQFGGNVSFAIEQGRTYYFRVYNGVHSPSSAPVTIGYCPFVDLWAEQGVNSAGYNQIGGYANLSINWQTSVMLKWNNKNSTRCDAASNPTVGVWQGRQDNQSGNTLSGFSKDVGALDQTAPPPYVFAIECSNSNGTASDSVQVTVGSPPAWLQTVGGDVHSNTKIEGPVNP